MKIKHSTLCISCVLRIHMKYKDKFIHTIGSHFSDNLALLLLVGNYIVQDNTGQVLGYCLNNSFCKSGPGVTYSCNSHLKVDKNVILSKIRRAANVGTMLGQRRRRWTNIVLTLGECPVVTGMIS